jgi:hypothetical protein
VLTFTTIADMSRALQDAEREVVRLEGLAADHPGSLFFPSDEARRASAARSTLEAIYRVRDGAIEDGDELRAAEVVANARQLGRPGGIGEPLQTVGDRLPEALPSAAAVKGWTVAVLVVLALAVVAYFLRQLRAFVPGRVARAA